MKRRTRTVILVCLACLAAASLALFLWLPWSPFEADAGPLDAWVPRDVDAVVRFDGGALQRSEVLRTLWNGDGLDRLLRRLDLDKDVVQRADRDLADLPMPGAPVTVEGDLFGRETLVAFRGDDFLVLTRITARCKAIDLIRRAGDARRAQWGIQIDGDGYVAAKDPNGRFGRRRDVLIASNSKGLFDSAMALASGRGESIATRADYRDAPPAVPVDAKIGAWATGKFLARLVGKPPIVEPILRPLFEHPARVDVDATAARDLRVAARFVADGPAMRDVSQRDAAADRLADPAEAFAVGALPLAARDVVAALFDSQPEDRRRVLDHELRSMGTSRTHVIDLIARHFDDGVGFVVARPSGADAPTPIPVTFALLRIASGEASALLDELRRSAEALFGRGVELVTETGPGGARILRCSERAPFGPAWPTLDPAFAVTGDDLVFCTNAASLRAALTAPRSAPARGDVVAAVRINSDPLRSRKVATEWQEDLDPWFSVFATADCRLASHGRELVLDATFGIRVP